MKKCSSCQIQKELHCFSRNKATKDGFQNVCKPCKSSMNKSWKLNNPELVRAHAKDGYWRNPEKARETVRSYSLKNSEKIKLKAKKYRETHQEEARVWRMANPEKVKQYQKNNAKARRASCAKYRANKRSSMLLGFEEAVREVYLNCPVGFEVDHIVPVRGKNVCGLHVPWNLQYLSPQENRRKGNRHV